MAKKRNTVTYQLKKGRKVVYIGKTNDPERREQEHKKEGKKFTKMLITSPRKTEDGAKKQEQNELERYKKNQGKLPRYNKSDDG